MVAGSGTSATSTTGARRGGAPAASSAEGDGARKQRVLTKGRASVVSSITDAVVAKDGEPFFLCQPDGQVPVQGSHGYGFYHHDCRFLRGYELTIGGHRPDPLAATEQGGTTVIIELTNPDLGHGQDHIDKEQLGLTWTRRVDEGGPVLRDEIAIHNYGADEVEVPLGFRFAGGFEDVFVIRGLIPEEAGHALDATWHGDALSFAYDGRDGITRRTTVRLDPRPERQDPTGCEVRVRVRPRTSVTVRVEVRLEEAAAKGVAPIERRSSPARRPRANEGRDARDEREPEDGARWVGGEGWATSVRTSSFALRAALGRSLDDLGQLRSELDSLRYYEAGVPWFATLFGRDALISALQSLPFDPDIAAETLRLLASRQGRRVDDWRDEQPGRILHELRIGELARIGAIPHTPYYGTIDATPLFLLVLARHAAWSGSLDLFEELRGAVDAALAWMDAYGDTDGDGFIDYRSATDRGLVNQGWKDSGDAIVNAKGDIAEPPIALAEVQGYAYRAWAEIAGLFERSGDAGRAAALRRRASEMRERFEPAFWSTRLGCYVLAIANGEPCDVVTSNAGQVLWTGIASAEHATAVAERLMRDDMFNGWGIRTLSSEAIAYHPVGYHLGTVWPHDNSLIAAGFRRYGLEEAAERVFLGLLEAAHAFPHERLPECFSGFSRDRFGVPVRYPVACHPQAWAAGAIPYLLMSTLGLEANGLDGELLIRDPRLPEGIEVVEIKDLPVGGGTAHLRFERRDGTTAASVLGTTGGLRVTAGTSRGGREA